MAISMLGIPLDHGSSTPGCLMGPDALRVAGIHAALADLGHNLSDRGNLEIPQVTASAGSAAKLGKHGAEMVCWTQSIHAAVSDMLQDDAVPLLMGGDHAMSMGSVSALSEHAHAVGRPLYVLWLDAHTDFNTPESSPSGHIHGMPVAYFCGLPGFDVALPAQLKAPVDPQHVLMMGIRSIDQTERALVQRHGIELRDMRDIDEHGVVGPLRSFLNRVRADNGLLHVSLDVDFLDPMIAPAVGTTVPGGVTLREAHLIMELVYESGLLTSLEVAELNPALDVASSTARVLIDLIASAFGRRLQL